MTAECDAPVASVATVETAHGINANAVTCWRQFDRASVVRRHEFVAAAIAPPTQFSASECRRRIKGELRRGL